ncbi:glycoside hydrolase family 68 protein [Metabacillus bambusae]|uniref:Glycoside hydrolase family 68 protein n=1 Tax=Metabacillus bambusae TaxID=2795218 RepID=A0ABS3N5J0_9BACI|nr:glycoside hydrolase family 68 protein [Metabacillus bambusae]MBO1513484.1 glycoside hydrolase family 68 protein [Metabacillus bambusae]
MERNIDKKGKFFIAAIIGLSAIFTPIVSSSASAKENLETYNWTREDVSNLTINAQNTAPEIKKDELVEMTSESYIWDSWPLQEKNGHPAVVNGFKIIFALSVPNDVLPGKRHDTAEIHYFFSKDGKSWESGGPVFKDGDALGSRQWAGSSIVHKDGKLQIFYTATGDKNETQLSYDQRVATATADITTTNTSVTFENWSDHEIILEPDGEYYQTNEQTGPEESSYAFRDPYFFQDPKTGEEYLLFEANSAGKLEDRSYNDEYIGSVKFRQNHENPESSKAFNGSIGIAKASNQGLSKFNILPPLLEANYVNDELERPSVIVKGNNYYLFAKTHSEKFATGLHAPEGLYGFTSDSLFGGYQPLNESGLVIANPTDNPYQAYSWMVMPNGTVTSFVNYVNVDGKDIYEIGEQSPDYQMEHFGGMLAPSLKLSLTRNESKIVHEKKQGVFK